MEKATGKILFQRRGAVLLLLFCISGPLLDCFSAFAQASRRDVGQFDIRKVRQAARDGDMPQLDSSRSKLPQTPSMAKVAARMVVSLALILLLLIGVVYAFRRITYRGRAPGVKSSVMDVLETTGIIPGKSLSLVRVGDRVLLLGISQDGMRCLSEFDGEKALDIIRATDRGNSPTLFTQFSDNLNTFMGRFRTRNTFKTIPEGAEQLAQTGPSQGR